MKVFNLVFYLFFSHLIHGQDAGRIWYWGNSGNCSTLTASGPGLDFNSGSPILLTNGSIGNSESSATQNDRNGSLLFYSNGINVWDRTHSVMLNGIGLGGDSSTAQSALIIPFVNDPSKFYIFAQNGMPTSQGTGLHYSVVDMSLNSGLGGVTAIKSVLLQSGTGEALTATKHSNGIDYWVIDVDYDSSIFYSYKVSFAGISSPVKTNLGFNKKFDLRIHFNNSGNKIWFPAEVNFKTIRFIADFDLNTGVVSNKMPIDTGYIVDAAEFSPNDSLLYTMSIVKSSPFQFALAQFQVYAPNIFATRQVIYGPASYPYFTDLKLAPNGKIYLNRFCKDSIDVINSPNQIGSNCNWQRNILSLANKSSGFSFPNETFSAEYLTLSVSGNSVLTRSVNIFPNPCSDYIHISSSYKIIEVNLLDSKGRTIMTTDNLNEENIRLTDFQDGFYIIKVVSSEEISHHKIIIRH